MLVNAVITSCLCVVTLLFSAGLSAQTRCEHALPLSEITVNRAINEHDIPLLQESISARACDDPANTTPSQLNDAIDIYLYLQDFSRPDPVASAERLLSQLSLNQNLDQLALYTQLLAQYSLHTDDVKQALALTHLLTSEILPNMSGESLAFAQIAVADIHAKIGFFQSVRDLLTPLLNHSVPAIAIQSAINLWHAPRDETQLSDVLSVLRSNTVQSVSLPLQARVALVLGKQAEEDNQPQLAAAYFTQAQNLAKQVGQTTLQTAVWLYQAQHGSDNSSEAAIQQLNALPEGMLSSADKLSLTTMNANRAQARNDWQASTGYYEKAQTLNQVVTRNKALAREYASFQLIEQAKALEAARQESELQSLKVEKQSQQQLIYLLALVCSLLCLAMVILLFVRKYKDAKRFEHLANTDGLTQVLNRRAVQDYAGQVRKEFLHNNKPFVLALADIDHFKSVNDTYGHDAGDIVLTTFAERAKLLIRQHDAVGRWGGEEWLFVLPATEISAVQGLFERLRKAVAEVDIGTQTLNITFSMGAVQANGQTEVITLINQADELLYKAKRNGRDQLCVPNGQADTTPDVP